MKLELLIVFIAVVFLVAGSLCVPVTVPCDHCGQPTPVERPPAVQLIESLSGAPEVVHYECFRDWCQCQ